MDRDLEIAAAIKATHEELDAAREVVRTLANELADVIDVVEPILADHTKRIRQARITALDEMRQVTVHLKDMREVLLAPQTDRMLAQAERFLAVCRELEEFRAVGFLDAFIQLFAGYGKETTSASH